ncbi:MAG: alpha/beta hydrolase [Candidatus Limnocylindrales bacterium]
MSTATTRPSRRRRWITIVLAVVAVIGISGYGAVSFMVYDGVGKAPRSCWPGDQSNTPDSFRVPREFDQGLAQANVMPVPQDVTFRSRDPQIPDAELAAWWIPAEKADAPAVILVHGVQSCRREASVLLAAGMLHRNGLSVFLMDIRDHGDSQGDDARFAGGSEEYMDVLGGWDWVRSQGVPAERIGLLGFSFGSISAVVAGAREPGVAAVWADSSTTTMHEGIRLFLKDQMKDGTGLTGVLVPGAILWARIIAGDDLTAFNPIDQLGAYGGRSIAFVHGADDPVLPATMATELRKRAVAAGATTPDAWIVAGAKHTQGIYVDPAGYEQRLVAFFSAALGAP